jgi:hypothetical protein
VALRHVALILLCALGTGCGAQAISLSPQARSFTSRDYEKVYDAWTRDADEFEFGRLSDVLNATATFQSWEFRWAYVVRYAHDYSLSTEARTEMLRASLADAEQHHRFFITMVGTDFRESDLSREESAWRVLLVDQRGAQTVPIEVDKVDPTAAEKVYFPSISPFRHAYRIVFPAFRADGSPTIPPDADFVILRFTGARGAIDLRWSFVDGPTAPPSD